MPVWLSGFLTAIVVGTLVEYWGHRMMHSWLLRTKHALHHRDGIRREVLVARRHGLERPG